LLGLILGIGGTIGFIVWWVSTIRQTYPRLGPISFALALLGFALYWLGGWIT
jgi:hypothetical protein